MGVRDWEGVQVIHHSSQKIGDMEKAEEDTGKGRKQAVGFPPTYVGATLHETRSKYFK